MLMKLEISKNIISKTIDNGGGSDTIRPRSKNALSKRRNSRSDGCINREAGEK